MLEKLLMFIDGLKDVSGQSANPVVYWVLVGLVGLFGLGAFFAFFLLYRITKKSVFETEKDVRHRLDALRSLVSRAEMRLRRLDAAVISRMHSLPQRGSQAFNVLKQTIGAMRSRLVEVENLLATKRVDSLLKAQQILSSPLNTAGDQLNSVLFTETVVSLRPDQFELGLNVLFESVENALSSAASNPDGSMKTQFAPRKRKFTIRGLINSFTGNIEE